MKLFSKLGVAALLPAMLIGSGCGSESTAVANVSGKTGPAAITPEQMCAVLARPQYESNSPFDGATCSGSTTFGAPRDPRSVAPTTGPVFTYVVHSSGGKVSRVSIDMLRRPDGGQFFAAVADSVFNAMTQKPAPEQIRNAITAPFPDVNVTERAGPATANLVRRSTDNGYTLTFTF